MESVSSTTQAALVWRAPTLNWSARAVTKMVANFAEQEIRASRATSQMTSTPTPWAGSAATATTVWAFAPARFDHISVGCDLQGLHRTLPCVDCHKSGQFRRPHHAVLWLPSGRRTWPRNAQWCCLLQLWRLPQHQLLAAAKRCTPDVEFGVSMKYCARIIALVGLIPGSALAQSPPDDAGDATGGKASGVPIAGGSPRPASTTPNRPCQLWRTSKHRPESLLFNDLRVKLQAENAAGGSLGRCRRFSPSFDTRRPVCSWIHRWQRVRPAGSLRCAPRSLV